MVKALESLLRKVVSWQYNHVCGVLITKQTRLRKVVSWQHNHVCGALITNQYWIIFLFHAAQMSLIMHIKVEDKMEY